MPNPMKPDRAAQRRDLFLAALELPPGRRTSFLAGAAGDEELRAEVDALLKADQAAEGFLASPVSAHSADDEPDTPSRFLGRSVGQYVLVRVLGRGGMGTVFAARQNKPERLVALKLMHPLLGTGAWRRRLEREADLLARLSHPNIAHVFESGVHREDAFEMPFIAMELIDCAHSLTRFARNANLSVPERLGIFLLVCAGVEHAHQRGVVHCDLKPGNILVSARPRIAGTELPIPKVIDFGIARLADANEITSMYPTAGALAGTLAYMSPEQRAGDRSAIDTRSDIFALGTILFELLTNRLPASESLRLGAGAIGPSEEVPVPGAHASRLFGDLHAIVDQARRDSPGDRYQTVAELAEDVRRYLAREPVMARRGQRMYWFRKTVVRHWLAVSLSLVFVGLLTLATLSSALLYRSAEQQRDISEARAEQLRRSGYYKAIALADAAIEARMPRTLFDALDGCPKDLRGWEWHYLDSVRDDSLYDWQGHQGTAGAEYSPDGRRLLSWGWDGVVRVWDASTGRLELALAAHDGPISDADASYDGTRIVSAGYDGTVRVWDALNGRQQHVLRGDSQRPTSVAFSPDGTQIASGGYTSRIFLWDAHAYEEIAVLDNGVPAYRLVFSSDGRQLIVGGTEGDLVCWLLAGRMVRWHVQAHEALITCLRVSHSGDWLVSAGWDARLRTWDLHRGILTGTRDCQTDVPLQVAIAPGDDFLTIAGGSIRTWALPEWSEQAPRFGHRSGVSSVHYSPDGKHLVSAGTDGRLVVRNASSPSTVMVGHQDTVRSVAILGAGKRAVSTGTDGTLCLWDLDAVRCLQRVDCGLAGHDNFLAVNSRDPIIAVGGANERIEFWEASGSALSRSARSSLATGGLVTGLCFSSKPGLLAWTTRQGECVVGTIAGRVRARWAPGLGALSRPTFVPDGERLLVCCNDGAVRIWSWQSDRVQVLQGHDGAVNSVTCSADGRRVASAGADGKVCVWDLAEGTLLWCLQGHRRPVQSVAFLPRDDRLASGGYDHLINLWNLDDGELMLTLRGHSGGVPSLAFTPNGEVLVSGSNDRSLRIWSRMREPSSAARASRLDDRALRRTTLPASVTTELVE